MISMLATYIDEKISISIQTTIQTKRQTFYLLTLTIFFFILVSIWDGNVFDALLVQRAAYLSTHKYFGVLLLSAVVVAAVSGKINI